MGGVILVDFDDSFTYNIVGEVWALGIEVEVVSHRELTAYLKEQQMPALFIWGPGPGHPRDYPHVLSLLPALLTTPGTFHFGVCLGHQLILYAQGFVVGTSATPVHGQNFSFTVPSWEHFPLSWHERQVQVQRYNSLVPLWDEERAQSCELPQARFQLREEEIWSFSFAQGITYQFHPESVGTSPKAPWFWPLQSFFYNRTYEGQTTALRGDLRSKDF